MHLETYNYSRFKAKISTEIKVNQYIMQWFQKMPVTSGLPLPVGPLTAVCLDFINENKNDINKKANSTTTLNWFFLG